MTSIFYWIKKLSVLDDAETKREWPFYTMMMFIDQSDSYVEGVNIFVEEHLGSQSFTFQESEAENKEGLMEPVLHSHGQTPSADEEDRSATGK